MTVASLDTKYSAPQVSKLNQPGKNKRGILANSGIGLLSTLIAILALEAIFAVAGVGEQEFLTADDVTGFAPFPGKTVTWRQEGFSHSKFNSFGMPDIEHPIAKPEGVYRIAFIGDSYTEALQVDRDNSFCRQLEKSLNTSTNKPQVECLNFGVSAYNLAQMYLRLKHLALKFNPDLIVIGLRIAQNPGIDVVEHPGGLPFVRPTFILDNRKILVENDAVQQRWINSDEGKRMRALNWVRCHSRIWGVISLCARPVLCAFRRKDPIQKEVSAEAQWSIAGALLNACKEETTVSHCKLIVMALPGPGQLQNSDLVGLLRASLAKSGIPLLDVSPQFVAATAKGENLFFTSHMNERGHQLVASRLAQFLMHLSAVN